MPYRLIGLVSCVFLDAQVLVSLDYSSTYNLKPSPQKNTFLTSELGSSLTLNNGSIVNQGSAFFGGDSVYLYQGILNNTLGGSFASCASGYFYINGATVSAYNDAVSKIGPCQLVMTNGAFQNQGLLTLDLLVDSGGWNRELANSIISGGSITGAGDMWVSGNLSLSSNLTQNQLFVGQGVNLGDLTTPENTYAKINLSQAVINATCTILEQGMIQGNGTISQNTTSYGLVYPATGSYGAGVLDIDNDIDFIGTTSALGVNIDQLNASLLNVTGSLNFDPFSVVYLEHIQNQPRGQVSYTITQAGFSNLILPSLENLSGRFYPLNLEYSGNDLVLSVEFPSTIPSPPSYITNPSIAAMVDTLNTLDGHCPEDLQGIINQIIALPQNEIYQVVGELLPYLKKAQFLFEKLDLAIGEDLRDRLYEKVDHTSPFMMVGYNYIHEKKDPYYVGYNSNSYYEFFGTTFGPKKIRGQAAIGFGQIFMNVVPKTSGGAAYSAYLSGGGVANLKWFSVGVDFLASVARMNAWRNISYFDLKAKDKRNLWNFSYTGKGECHLLQKRALLDVYTEIGQNLGKESPYLETGASGANLYVCKERINVFRTSVGLKLATEIQKPLSFFLDGAYVYDKYRNNQSFYTAFRGTNVFTKITDIFPPHNLIRIKTGLSFNYKDLRAGVSYTGIFGKKFTQNNANLDFKINF